jgi:hypothetical protein
MEKRKRNDGKFDLLDDEGTVIAVASKEVIEKLEKDALAMLNSRISIRSEDGE